MEKIPTMFVRDFATKKKRIINEPHLECGWVFAGEGVATRKLDGACCCIKDGHFFKRYQTSKPHVPEGFVPVDYDESTGKQTGWVPVGVGPEDQYFREGLRHLPENQRVDGTYELVGPKVQANFEKRDRHELVNHRDPGLVLETEPARRWDALVAWSEAHFGNIEGIVYHHPDGRMAKIKCKEFRHLFSEHDKGG